MQIRVSFLRRIGFGLSIVALVGVVALVELGCSSKPDDAKTEQALEQKKLEPFELDYPSMRARIFTPYCVGCHGERSRVNLATYENIRQNLAAIERVTLIEKSMPKNAKLTEEELSRLGEWLAMGAPESKTQSQELPTPLPSEQPVEVVAAKFSSIKKLVIDQKCVSCHSAGGSASGVNLTSYRELMGSPRELVIAGNPDESGLMIALTRTDSKRMPPPKNTEALDAPTIEVIRQWIDQGALND